MVSTDAPIPGPNHQQWELETILVFPNIVSPSPPQEGQRSAAELVGILCPAQCRTHEPQPELLSFFFFVKFGENLFSVFISVQHKSCGSILWFDFVNIPCIFIFLTLVESVIGASCFKSVADVVTMGLLKVIEVV